MATTEAHDSPGRTSPENEQRFWEGWFACLVVFVLGVGMLLSIVAVLLGPAE